jgi:hypothetical protein
MADQARQPDGGGRTESSARYSLVIGEEAREQLRALPKPLEKHMSRSAKQRKANRPSVRQLQSELQHLRRRVEDLEDLRDLNAAIERNAGKPGVPWSEVKRELGFR